VEYFQAQTWPNKELVILDDLDARSFPGPLIGKAGIQYHLMQGRHRLGAKRNLAVSRATGEFIAHWDDDDYSAPERLEEQMLRLLETHAQITGYHSMIFMDEFNRKAWLYNNTSRPYCIGSSLLYRREYWQEHRFNENIACGEDDDFSRKATGTVVSVDANGVMFARLHSGNTSIHTLGDKVWREVPWQG
jgi:glycosyltransferase involved in cell wall biosynthesis